MTQPPPSPDGSPPPPPPFPAWRSALALVAVTGVALLAAAAMLVGLGRPGMLGSAAASGAVCLGAALAALEPVRRAARVSVQRVVTAAMAAMAIRVALSLVGIALLIWLTPLPTRTTALWALGWYLLLLLAEVFVLRRYFQQLPAPHAATNVSSNEHRQPQEPQDKTE